MTTTYGMLIAILLAFPLTSHSVCYYPNGNPTLQDEPCFGTAESACCGQGYACLSNGICMALGDTAKIPGRELYARGSCTDKTWTSSDCLSVCVNPKLDHVDGGNDMFKCDTNDKWFYCKEDVRPQPNCTSGGGGIITFGVAPTVAHTIGVSLTPSKSASASSSSPSSTTSTTISTATSNTDKPTTSAPTQTPTSESQSESESDSRSLSTGAKAGIGAGVGIGGLVVIVLAAVWALRRRRSKKATASTDLSDVPKSSANIFESDSRMRYELAE